MCCNDEDCGSALTGSLYNWHVKPANPNGVRCPPVRHQQKARRPLGEIRGAFCQPGTTGQAVHPLLRAYDAAIIALAKRS